MKKPNLKKIKSVSIPDRVKKPFRRKSADEKFDEALKSAPRITNESVSEHREEILSSARKFIYPLQHSKKHVVRTSLLLFVGVLAAFFIFCGLALYKFQATGTFIYGVSQVIPFPVAKAGDDWVTYENYLFELRRNMHYYSTQQKSDFKTKDGKQQLTRLKQQALNQVIRDSYVRQLADKNDVSISNAQVRTQVDLVRSQNRIGNNDRVFRDVLNQFWGWSVADFERELKQQLLQQAVITKLDTQTLQQAQTALKQLQTGTDFGSLATQVSEDPTTKASGGQYPFSISRNQRDISPVVTAALFRLKPNQISGIIDTGYSLEILKVTEKSGSNLRAAHIQFNLNPISTYVDPEQKAHPVKKYISV